MIFESFSFLGVPPGGIRAWRPPSSDFDRCFFELGPLLGPLLGPKLALSSEPWGGPGASWTPQDDPKTPQDPPRPPQDPPQDPSQNYEIWGSILEPQISWFWEGKIDVFFNDFLCFFYIDFLSFSWFLWFMDMQKLCKNTVFLHSFCTSAVFASATYYLENVLEEAWK